MDLIGDPSKINCGELYLIPNLLGETEVDTSLPPLVARITAKINYFVVEEERAARRFIKQLLPDRVIREITFATLNEHTKPVEVEALTAPLLDGHDVGIISDAGLPGVADPGAALVRRAHRLGIKVHPLVGPCSMMLALMASGFNGQRWRFVGYLSTEATTRKDEIRSIERAVHEFNETQILMDTPYRNQKLLEELISSCKTDTMLGVASALTTNQESIQVRSIEAWRAWKGHLPKSPSIFILGSSK